MTEAAHSIRCEPTFDVFISHASEDKEDVARPLAALLIHAGLRVWIDEHELLLGDSLRRKIDAGLSSSRFGVVILSKAFFGKEWPQKELDALVSREDGSAKVILPVWHNISREEVSHYSPLLSDRLSAATDAGLASVAAAVYKAVASDSNQKAFIIPRKPAAGPKSIQDLVVQFIDRVQQNYEDEIEVTGLRTGFYDLDRITGGLQPGELYVVAARPSVGSTTLVLNIAEHIATAEELPVLFFSPRAKSQEILNRLISAKGRIDRWHLATSLLDADEWTRLADAVERIHQTTLYIDDSSPMSLTDVAEGIRTKREELGALSLVVVDNFDALNPLATPHSEDEAIRYLWNLARESNCALVVTIPLPRSVDTRIDKRPTMADIRAGEVIEQTAAAVAFLYRDDYYNRDSLEPGILEVILARHRGGLTGTIKLLFMRAIAKIENISNEIPQPSPRSDE